MATKYPEEIRSLLTEFPDILSPRQISQRQNKLWNRHRNFLLGVPAGQLEKFSKIEKEQIGNLTRSIVHGTNLCDALQWQRWKHPFESDIFGRVLPSLRITTVRE